MPYWQHIWQTHVHLHMGILVFFKHIEFSFKFSPHFGEKSRHHHPFFSFSFFIILPTKHPLKILSSLPHNLKTKHSIYVATLLYAISSTNFLHFLTWQLHLLQYISLTFIFSSPYYSIHLRWNCSFSSYFFYFDFSSPHFIYYKNLPFLFSFNIQSGKYSLSLSLLVCF